MAVDRNGLEIVERSECLRLLASRQVGRVGLVARALPAVLPVNYRLLGSDIIFATGTGSTSLAVAAGQVLAFEVDDIDEAGHSGWSVLVVGVGEELHPSSPEMQAAAAADLRPWMGRFASQIVRIRTDRLSGRRLAGNDRWRPIVTALAQG